VVDTSSALKPLPKGFKNIQEEMDAWGCDDCRLKSSPLCRYGEEFWADEATDDGRCPKWIAREHKNLARLRLIKRSGK
jgi:hypothetical protein